MGKSVGFHREGGKKQRTLRKTLKTQTQVSITFVNWLADSLPKAEQSMSLFESYLEDIRENQAKLNDLYASIRDLSTKLCS
jgi:hypothetical protein